MTLIKPEGPDAAILDAAAEAESHLREMNQVFRELMIELRSDPAATGGVTPAKLRDMLHEYRKIAHVAMQEARSVSELSNRSKGIVRDFALDLRAARDEIGGRLARFAAVRREAGVSGGAE